MVRECSSALITTITEKIASHPNTKTLKQSLQDAYKWKHRPSTN